MSRGKITGIEFIKELKKLKVLSFMNMGIKKEDTFNKENNSNKYPFLIDDIVPRKVISMYITPISYCTNLT